MRSRVPIWLVALLLALAFELLFPGFYLLDDNLAEYQPAYSEIAGQWAHGRVPLTSDLCWYGGDFWGELQLSLFSPFHQAILQVCRYLPDPRWRAALLSACYLSLLAEGIFRLARQLGLRDPWAASASMAGGFNGWMLQNGARDWVPMLATFACLPWVWLALERKLNRRNLALLIGASTLTALNGFPFGLAALVLLVALECLRSARNPRRVLALLGAELLAAALSFPAWVGAPQYLKDGLRPTALDTDLCLTPSSLVGCLAPHVDLWSQHSDNAHFPLLTSCFGVGFTAVAALLAPIVLRRRAAWGSPAVVLCAALTLSLVPVGGGLRWPVRWMPLALVALALLGHRWLQQVDEERGNPGLWGACLILPAWLAWTLTHGLDAGATAAFASLLPFTLAWAWIWGRWPTRRGSVTLAFCVLALLSDVVILQAQFNAIFPALSDEGSAALLHPAPFQLGRRYLSLYPTNTESGKWHTPTILALRPSNTGMLAGLELVNGYSPFFPQRPSLLLAMGFNGALAGSVAQSRLRNELGPDKLFARWGVDGLALSGPFNWDSDLTAAGWTLAWTGGPIRIWHRTQRSPRVFAVSQTVLAGSFSQAFDVLMQRPADAPADCLEEPGASVPRVVRFGVPQVGEALWQEDDCDFDLRAAASGEALIVLARPLRHGDRAWLDGQPLRLAAYDGWMTSIHVPAGMAGHVRVRRRPPELEAAVIVSLLAGCLALLWVAKCPRE